MPVYTRFMPNSGNACEDIQMHFDTLTTSLILIPITAPAAPLSQTYFHAIIHEGKDKIVTLIYLFILRDIELLRSLSLMRMLTEKGLPTNIQSSKKAQFK
jgi:hypothetical protein